MTHNQKTLALVEKIAKSNKYVQTKINDTNNIYIWHSEKGKTTCENCSSLDNVKFYPGDKMPIPPLHPHCKCELEEIKQDNSNDNNSNNTLKGSISKEEVLEYKPIESDETKEETKEEALVKEQPKEIKEIKNTITIKEAEVKLNQSEEKLQEINSKINEINETIEKDIDFDFQVLDEQIKAISPSFDMDLDLLESEKENHEPNCKELTKRITEVNKRKEEFTKIKNEVEDNKKKIEEIRKRLKEIDHEKINAEIDRKFLEEKRLEPWNVDNAIIKEMQNLAQNINSIFIEIKQIMNNIQVIIKNNDTLKNKLSNLIKSQNQPIEKIICNCHEIINKVSNADKIIKMAVIDEIGKGVSPFFPVGGSNIQDAMHDFEYAKQNPNVKIVEALNENNDEKLNKIMEELKLEKGTKTAVYNENSAQSKKIYHSEKIQEYIKTNLINLIEAKGKAIETIGLEFQANIEFDLYVGIQNFTLHNPKITKDGYFEAIVYDKYDFAYRPIKDWIHLLKTKEGETFIDNIKTNLKNKLNNIGFDMQEGGLLEKYELIYLIKEKVLE